MEGSLPFQGFKEEERLVNGSDKSFQIFVVLSDLALPILAIILFIILYYALNQSQGGMCISGVLKTTEMTPRPLASPLGPKRVGTERPV